MKKLSVLLAFLFLAAPALVFAEGAVTKAANAATVKANAAATAKIDLVDLNSATEEQLKKLPVITDESAKAIIAGRPWPKKDSLVAKKVLSAEEYAKIKDFVVAKQPTMEQRQNSPGNTLGTSKLMAQSTPRVELIDINSADQTRLKMLPGLTEENIQAIIAGRPWAQKEQLLSKKAITPETYAKLKGMIVAKQPARAPVAPPK